MNFSNLAKPKGIVDPPHYVPLASISKDVKGKGRAKGNATVSESEQDALKTLRQRRAWDVALGPGKSIPIQAFMLWMSGNTIQIFSGMAVLMLFKNAIAGALAVNKAFLPLQATIVASPDSDKPPEDELLPQKAVFVLCQGLLLGLAIYKVHTMGLLPTHESDWLAWQLPPLPVELSSVSIG